jgi:hypothetical protein
MFEEVYMVLYRSVFQAKIGKAADMVAAFKKTFANMTEEQRASYQPRILTDISGRFDTVVLETTHESLAALERARQAMFAQAAAEGAASALFDLIDQGRNEYYTIES